MANKKILLIASAEDDLSVSINNDFVTELASRLGPEADIDWCNYHDLQISFFDSKLMVHRISTATEINQYDFIYIKSYFRYNEQAAVLAEYLQANAMPFVCSELNEYIPLTKLTQFAKLAKAQLPIVNTLFLHHSKYLESYDTITDRLGTPFIFKAIDGSGGDDNYLVYSLSELAQALEAHADSNFVAQQFIENDSDLRVLIVGGEIALIIERTRADGTHLNNTSQGGSAQLLPVEDLAPEHANLALVSAQVMKREIAGVDLMFERGTGTPYILEVNASPQIGSGAFMEEKLEIYCKYFKNVLK